MKICAMTRKESRDVGRNSTRVKLEKLLKPLRRSEFP